MNITYLLTSLGMGGTQLAVISQADVLSQWHRVTIISVNGDEDSGFFKPNPRVEVRNLVRGKGSDRRLIEYEDVAVGAAGAPARMLEKSDAQIDRLAEIALLRILPELCTDILVTTSPPLLGLAAQLLPPRVRLVHQEHRASEFRSGSAPVLHRYLGCADLVTVLAHNSKVFFHEEFGEKCPQVEVMPNALPGDGPRPLSALDQRTIVAAGRLVAEKRFDHLIRAFEIFHVDHPEWRLRICGDGPARRSLIRLVEGLALENVVEFVGRRTDMEEQWASASIAALTSHFEGFSLTLIEAMAAGVPVAAYDAPNGPAEIITDGVDGFLVPSGNIDGLAAALDQLADDETRVLMGNRASKVRDKYERHKLGRRWEVLFNNLLVDPQITKSTGSGTETGQLPVVDAHRSNLADDGLVVHRGWHADVGLMTPNQASERNLDYALLALEAAGIDYFYVPQLDHQGHSLGVEISNRSAFVSALRAAVGTEPVQVMAFAPAGKLLVKALLTDLPEDVVERTSILKIVRSALWPGHTLLLGAELSCDIEFWERRVDGGMDAPRANSVTGARICSSGASRSATSGRLISSPTLQALSVEPTNRVTFPIDAVYLWVDGQDPEWRARRDAARHGTNREPLRLHAEADSVERYRSRDELRYSLRSLEAFAPWIRNVYLVTDRQRPEWLNDSHPQLEIVDHREIFPEPWLPIFNSHSISSRLHHISGLSEHYLLINDDVFFGRRLKPEQFFTPAGQPRFFSSSVRIPSGGPLDDDLPHEGAQKRSASLLQEDFGRRPTRAFFHAPHPQSRRLHQELAQRYPGVYESTGRSRFRDAADSAIASVLHHGYGELTGQSVQGAIGYAYVNPSLPTHRSILTRLLRLRNRDAFCLNDALAPGSDDGGELALERFLSAYYPVPSEFENAKKTSNY